MLGIYLKLWINTEIIVVLKTVGSSLRLYVIMVKIIEIDMLK